MKKILVSGYIGFNNFGDEALLYILVNDLVQVGYKKENITVISNEPGITSGLYGVNSINRWNPFSFLRALLNCNEIIFIGGLFQDKTSFKSLCYYAAQLLLAGIFRKRVVLFAVGIGPLQRKISKLLLDIALSAVSLMTVRDQSSAQFLPHRGNVVVTCDPVWSINPDFSFKSQIKKVSWEAPIIGVSMRQDKYLRDFHLNNIADKISKILITMKEWQVLLIPCMPNEDIPVLYELNELISRKSSAPARVTLLTEFVDFPVTQQAGILASCEIMISMRYHALLMPIINSKPVFGLIFDQKVKSLLDFSSQVGVYFRDDLEQPWNYFWQNLQYSSQVAKKACEKARELNKINTKLLETMFNQP